MRMEEMGAEEKQCLPFTASHDPAFRVTHQVRTHSVRRTVITMKMLTLILVAVTLTLSACTTTPVPPHQSGDGGRGMNPGARAESANGAGVDRTAIYR